MNRHLGPSSPDPAEVSLVSPERYRGPEGHINTRIVITNPGVWSPAFLGPWNQNVGYLCSCYVILYYDTAICFAIHHAMGPYIYHVSYSILGYLPLCGFLGPEDSLGSGLVLVAQPDPE